MKLPPVRLSPLRLWLQSTSLLVVIAGYGILLLCNQGVSTVRRESAHRQLLNQLETGLQGRVTSASQFEAWQSKALLPGLELRQLPDAPPAARSTSGQTPGRESTQLIRSTEGAWLVSHLDIPLLDGSHLQLLVRQDMTTSVEQEELAFWWLVVAAGLSVLITSALLRQVLNRGLVQPLEEFTSQLQAFKAPPTTDDVIDVQQQPEELQPIALAFNQLQERVLESWERQRRFVDGVAHELRTPITLISGHAQSILRHKHVESTQAVQLIRDEAQRMGSLVRDLLDLARRDSGRLTLKRELINGDDALLELYERMRPKTNNRLRIGNIGSADSNTPQGFGDPDRLQQCLTTLVDNALLYSPPGSRITISCSNSPDNGLILHVRDHGPGVHWAEREQIFERFIRGSAGLTSDVRGSGIGLSVVKLLMEAMGGSALVTDPEDELGGADFQLHLPRVRP